MNRIVPYLMIVFLGAYGITHADDEYEPLDLPAQNIPENCAVWFDGCNTCEVGRYNPETRQYELVCTEMFCPPEMMESPRCIEYRDDEHHI